MQIEISYPSHTLNDSEVEKLKKQLMLFHKYDNEISKVEVVLKKMVSNSIKSYLCEIVVSIFGDTFSFTREANTYEESIIKVINATEEKINEILIHKHDIPEEVISTVKV